MQHGLRFAFYLSLAFAGAFGAALALQPTDAQWWFVRIAGALAFIMIVAALTFTAFSERPWWHRLLGWLGFVMLTLHVVLVAAWEPVFWQWLTPSIPAELVTGLLAATALLAALAAGRSRLLRFGFRPQAYFQVHRIAGTIACFAAGVHIALVAGMAIQVICLIALSLIAALTMVLARERNTRSYLIALSLVTVLIAVPGLQPLAELRLTSLRRSPIVPTGFSHGDHSDYACTACHHNFIDLSGNENCISCHKRLSTNESMRVDRLLHSFCSDCHRSELHADDRIEAPIDHCAGCHKTGAESSW